MRAIDVSVSPLATMCATGVGDGRGVAEGEAPEDAGADAAAAEDPGEADGASEAPGETEGVWPSGALDPEGVGDAGPHAAASRVMPASRTARRRPGASREAFLIVTL
jgi:hypothetical protein